MSLTSYMLSLNLPPPQLDIVPIHERRGSRPPAAQKVVRDRNLRSLEFFVPTRREFLSKYSTDPALHYCMSSLILFILVLLVVFYGY